MNTATLDTPEVKSNEVSTETLLEREFPLKRNLLRKIVNVFDNYYRINYIDRSTGFITESQFLKVEDGKIKKEDEAFS